MRKKNQTKLLRDGTKMSFLIKLRSKIRYMLTRQEEWAVRIVHLGVLFLSFMLINHVIGYQKLLNHWWVALVLALICMFIPVQGVSVTIIFFGLLHLMSLSTDVAVFSLVLFLVSYMICSYFQSKDTYHLIAGPVCFQLKIPFVMPISVGLLRGINELPSVVLGSIVAYYLKVVSDNASAFMEKGSEMTVSFLIQSKLLASPMFYIYVVTTVVVCIAVYFIRMSEIKYSWMIAVIVGTLVEFIVMLSGCLFLDGKKGIPMLAIGSAVTLFIGLVTAFLIQGVDYNRTEKVQFEDDDYYYYVTAVPKMHITEQEKEVKKITEERE